MIIKNKLKFVRTLRSPIKHFLIVGASGSGKDFYGERIMSKYFDKKFKVIDFFSLERFEGMGYSIPITDKDMIHEGKLLTGGVFEAKAYPNKIYMLNGNKLKYFPKLPKNVEIVSLKATDLDTQDLILLLGSTDSSRSLLYMILFDLKETENREDMNLIDVENYAVRITAGDIKFKGASVQTAFILRRNIALLKQSGIFNDFFPNGEPIKKINMNDVMLEKSITTFSCALLETQIERAVGLGILLKRIVSYNQENQHKIPLAIYFREIQQIYNSMNKSDDFFNMLRHYVYFIITEGRDNLINLICNAQTLSQVEPIRNYFNKVFALRLPMNEAKKLIDYAPINKATLEKMQMLDRGMGIYINNGIFEYVVHSLVPSFQKKQEGSDVLGFLGNIYGWNDHSAKLIQPEKPILDANSDDNSNKIVTNYNNNSENLISNKTLSSTSQRSNIDIGKFEEVTENNAHNKYKKKGRKKIKLS